MLTDAYTYLRKKVCVLGIIMYHPKIPEYQTELAKRVAQVHAQTILERVKTLSCPAEQKAKLIDTVKQIHKTEAGA